MIKRGRSIDRRADKKNKKAQVFGMPFSVIFSIFLIAIFLVVAIYAIIYFLDIKKCSEIGLFLDDFQSEIDRAWNSQSSELTFTKSLPSKIQNVCFADLNEEAVGASTEKEIYTELKKNAVYENNLFFYPQRATSGCLASTKINHINMTEMIEQKNPYCIATENGKINIKIEKGFFDALVKISEAD